MTAQARVSNAKCVSMRRSKRMRNLPNAASHACVRSTTQRCLPSRSFFSMPRRAIRELMPRLRRCRRHRAKSYPLSAWSLSGRLRGRPSRPGTAGMASTRSSRTTESCRLAPVTTSAKGRPRRSTMRWRLLPSLPRSVGFGPVCWPPGGWPPPRHRYLPDSNRSGHAHANASAGRKCRRSQMQPACQSRRRRQQVMPLPKPGSCGKSSHAIPVCSTNKMPFNAARSSTLGRPPWGEGSTVGSSGCNAFHNSLLIFFRAMTHGNAQQSCDDDTVLLAALSIGADSSSSRQGIPA